MELFIALRGGYKVECGMCLVKVKLGDAKKINGKFYCPVCYSKVFKDNSIKTDEIIEA